MSKHVGMAIVLLTAALVPACAGQSPPVRAPTGVASETSTGSSEQVATNTPPESDTSAPPETNDDDNTSEAQLEKLVDDLTHELQEAWCAPPETVVPETEAPQTGAPQVVAPQAEACESIRAFESAGTPIAPHRATFTLGAVMGSNGAFVVLRFQPTGDGLPRVAASRVRPENEGEVVDAERYIAGLEQHQRDLNSPVHAALEQVSGSEVFFSARAVRQGWLLEGPRSGLQLLRQKGYTLYLLGANYGVPPGLVVFPVPERQQTPLLPSGDGSSAGSGAPTKEEREACMARCDELASPCDDDAGDDRGALRLCGCARISCQRSCEAGGLPEFRCF